MDRLAAAQKLALGLPVVFLALSWDRVLPDRIFPPSEAVVGSWGQAASSLPPFNEGRGGLPGDPLNVVVVARAVVMGAALIEAGWIPAPRSFRGALLSGRRPLRDYRLRGRLQDVCWVRPDGPGGECRLRLWRTGLVDPGGRSFWWGAARCDRAGVPEPGRDRARDLVAETAAKSPRLRALVLLPVERVPREGVDDDDRAFTTDGRVAVAELR